ncbi:adenine deaminase [Anaerococcus sp. AGMB09787]|uniref:adenine deaminase n=1 Tax=Anaerococcus sp. AGMB09787 TaxID=2922869 RepID=UPI001FB0079E|nr:adenine deaminase [Anaerococcus sp. AGMB09787]
MKNLEEKILKASGREKADLVFKNARIVDVFSGSLIEGDLALADGIILGIGTYEGREEIDLGGKFISPTLIDSHVHIESSMVTPAELSKVLLVNGVSTIIADPHEIANVMGMDGVKYILNASKDLPIDVRIMLPSCVPSTDFEDSGAKLLYEDLVELKDDQRVLGLGEMMNYVGLINTNKEVLDKIKGFEDKIIDGHAPGLSGKGLNAYRLANVVTDHECVTISEMNDRIARGFYVQIRQGTSAKNAKALTKGITKDNLSRILFCTDDKHPEDLLRDGSINENIRIAIKNGVDPIDAIRIGSINAATCYGLKNKAALAPGYEASFIVLDDLNNFTIDSVYIKGKQYSKKDKLLVDIGSNTRKESFGNVKVFDRKLEDFKIRLESNKANIIEILPNELLTKKLVEEVRVEDGIFVADETYQKLCVIERHRGLNTMGKAIVKGFGLKNGAIGSTIAHDSHNIIIIGDNDRDIYFAMKEIEKMNGGIVVVQGEKILKSLPLEIAGLMTNSSLYETSLNIREILEAARVNLGLRDDGLDPIITLGFMSLPVIPQIKLTDKGLFDVENYEFIDIEA